MRKTINLPAVLVAITTALVACVNELETLRQTIPEGDAFSQNLAEQYLQFADFEAKEMYDWPDAYHFAAKGLAAAKGEHVEPELAKDWSLPSTKISELQKSRKRLAAILETGIKQSSPTTSAKAQASFDCWVEQQEENWQIDHIAACRSAFLAALDKLENTPEVQGARFTLILFPFDSSSLDRPEFITLTTMVARARALGYSNILVTGHADRAGHQSYNLALSVKRAKSVKQALTRHGVPPSLIRIEGKGEMFPRIPTPDGVREAHNRRVEIELSRPSAPTSVQMVTNW